jgi:CO/xanthine dehydrogenase FAD-binding subunit
MTVNRYFLPATREEALDLLARHGPSLLVIAGGTVTMPLINDGLSLPETVMGLRRAGLEGIEMDDGSVRIGAMTTLTELVRQDAIPLLRQAGASTASWAVRNMATIGGNLFTPPPGGDVAVALLALDARVVIASASSVRTVPLEQLYRGFLLTDIAPDELVVTIEVPDTPAPTGWLKLGRKHANTPAVVTAAARLVTGEDGRIAEARIALGAVGPHPLRARGAERALVGSALVPDAIAAAAASAAEESTPFTDAIATDWYRRRMTRIVVARLLGTLAGGGPA